MCQNRNFMVQLGCQALASFEKALAVDQGSGQCDHTLNRLKEGTLPRSLGNVTLGKNPPRERESGRHLPEMSPPGLSRGLQRACGVPQGGVAHHLPSPLPNSGCSKLGTMAEVPGGLCQWWQEPTLEVRWQGVGATAALATGHCLCGRLSRLAPCEPVRAVLGDRVSAHILPAEGPPNLQSVNKQEEACAHDRGKRVRREGKLPDQQLVPVLWGQQHSHSCFPEGEMEAQVS
jgi:hypothetical protein